MQKRQLFYLLLILPVFGIQAKAQNGVNHIPIKPGDTRAQINWQLFLGRNDMIFDTLTTKWEEGAFMGNGLLGAMVYMKDSNTLRFEIGRTDVADHREGTNELFNKCRLPIGHFILKPNGQIIRNTVRVDLWNAELRGRIITTKGSIEWSALTFAQTNVVFVDVQHTGDEGGLGLEWIPEESVSPRYITDKNQAPAGYGPNPPGTLYNVKDNSGINYYHQSMIAGGSYTTAWLAHETPHKKSFYISVGYAQHGGLSDAEAIGNIRQSATGDTALMITAHRNWWHNYYRQSFITMPDPLLESFYWIQLYKLASASRSDKPLIDLMGPWINRTPWPAYWWNLNIELTYSSLYAANHLDVASVLPATISKNEQNLVNNVPKQYRYNALALGRASGIGMSAPIKVTDDTACKALPPSVLELGDATWMLYYYWLQYRYSMNRETLANLYPLLKKSINYYLDVAQKGLDGKYHLPYTYSPEYPNGTTRDCNYDLSLLRWGCQTLIDANDLLKLNDYLKPKWEDMLQNLTAYPTDVNGLKIGQDVALSVSHRHFSHMLMIYPLHLLNWEQPESRELIEKSLNHWQSMPNALKGYSFAGAASIYATMGNGGQSRDYLHKLISQFVKPNTMYTESGPVIETPLAAATSIQEMYLQSWGGKIRVFPAIPDDWPDAAFENMRAEGAFLVSAVRKDYKTQWVSIKAEVGGICRIIPGINGLIKIKSAQNVKLKDEGNGTYSILLGKNEQVTLYTEDDGLKIPVQETQAMPGKENLFGTKR